MTSISYLEKKNLKKSVKKSKKRFQVYNFIVEEKLIIEKLVISLLNV